MQNPTRVPVALVPVRLAVGWYAPLVALPVNVVHHVVVKIVAEVVSVPVAKMFPLDVLEVVPCTPTPAFVVSMLAAANTPEGVCAQLFPTANVGVVPAVTEYPAWQFTRHTTAAFGSVSVQRFTGERASVNVEVVREKLHCVRCTSGADSLMYGVVPDAVIAGAEPLNAKLGTVCVAVNV